MLSPESPLDEAEAIIGVGETPMTNADGQPAVHECGYDDVEQVAKISQLLLVSLGTACVEKTAGDPFNQPGSVYGDVKKEMLEYLNAQSDAFFNGNSTIVVTTSGEIPNPVRVVQDIVDSFTRSKKNLYSRVSSKLLYGDKKDEKIEDFVREIVHTGAWLIGRREILAKALLKRVDKSNIFHCEKTFESSEELEEHRASCGLRPLTCANEGCGAVFSAFHVIPHDLVCRFKVLPCEQGCESVVARGEMDMHCVTVCPMKVINCPFAQVGCTQSIPQGVQDQHCADFMGQHLLLVCHNHQKQGVAVGNQAQRIALLEKAMQISQRAEAVDVGTLLVTVREQDLKLKTLEQEIVKLRQEMKAKDSSGEVLQLKKELQSVHKKVDSSNPPSPIPPVPGSQS